MYKPTHVYGAGQMMIRKAESALGAPSLTCSCILVIPGPWKNGLCDFELPCLIFAAWAVFRTCVLNKTMTPFLCTFGSWFLMTHHDPSWSIMIHHDSSWCIMIRHWVMVHHLTWRSIIIIRPDASWCVMVHQCPSWSFMNHDASWAILSHHDATLSWWIEAVREAHRPKILVYIYIYIYILYMCICMSAVYTCIY